MISVLRPDCYFYYLDHDMNSSIPCCTCEEVVGNKLYSCPCDPECEWYVSRRHILKLGLETYMKQKKSKEDDANRMQNFEERLQKLENRMSDFDDAVAIIKK